MPCDLLRFADFGFPKHFFFFRFAVYNVFQYGDKLLYDFAHNSRGGLSYDLLKVDVAVAACLVNRGQDLVKYPMLKPFCGGELAAYDQAIEVAFVDVFHLLCTTKVVDD